MQKKEKERERESSPIVKDRESIPVGVKAPCKIVKITPIIII